MASIWVPLESNPEVLTKYLHKLGVSDGWVVSDVVALDNEMLEWIPKPVRAIILLYPYKEAFQAQHTGIQSMNEAAEKYPAELFFMQQKTENACGTVALIHCVANNKDILIEGVLKRFLDNVEGVSPEERGLALEKDEGFARCHAELAQEGQTIADPDGKSYHHFIALVNKNGGLYALDGTKPFPIYHGKTTDETFLQDAALVCKTFIDQDPAEIGFSVLALGAKEQE